MISRILRDLYHFVHPGFQNLFMEYRVVFKARYTDEKPHGRLKKIIDAGRADYRSRLTSALSKKDKFRAIGMNADPERPDMIYWNNGFLPGLDIVMIYTMMAELNPENYLEIGSGFSTRTVRHAIVSESLRSRITCIDPQPRTEIDNVADHVIREAAENTSFDIAGKLKKGDILFIDNSHRILPNSDSMVFFLEILPELASGVIVQVHDIYLPYDYPQLMCDRFYSEQYGLAIYLLANPGKFRILLPNYYISKDVELSGMLSALWNSQELSGVERHGGSFWFEVL